MSSQIVFDVAFAASDEHREKEEMCLRLWQRAIGYVNHVLETDKIWGLLQFKDNVNPSFDELRKRIDTAKELFDRMAKFDGLTHGAANALLNCSQAFVELRCTFDAVVEQKQAVYDDCIARLNAILDKPI